ARIICQLDRLESGSIYHDREQAEAVSMIRTIRFSRGAAALAALMLLPLFVSAERRSSTDRDQSKPVGDSVELFSAMESGKINVKFVAKNDRDAQVQIKNNTDRPLSVRLLDAFAAAPVLAHVGGFGAGAGGGRRSGSNRNGNNNNNNQQQMMGGGMGMMGGMGGMGMGMGRMGGMGGMGGGGGFFNVAPEAEGKFHVET